MDISSQRFRIWSKPGLGTFIRDQNAPYHCWPVAPESVPSVSELAAMSESRFDKLMSRLAYGESS